MFANKIHEEAHALMQSGDIQGSIALYTKAMEQDPKDCNLISDRAVAYLHLNEKENCFKDFDLALSITVIDMLQEHLLKITLVILTERLKITKRQWKWIQTMQLPKIT
jgi:tetratricopeptide (TPR) repeat protein